MTALVVTTLGAIAASFVAHNAASARALLGSLGSIDVTIVVFGLVGAGLAIANRGMLNRSAHLAVGLDADVGPMIQTAAVGFAAQKMVKSAGAVGLSVFVRHGRRRGHAPAEVAAACVLTAAGSFVALGILLVTAIAVLAATGRLAGWWIAAAIGFALYAAVVAAGVLAIARSRRTATWMWERAQRVRRYLPGGDRTGASDAAFPVGLFTALSMARRRPDALRLVVLHALASKALGALMLTAAVRAAGLPVGVPAALVIYATALAASMVTIVPGGFGAVEGSMLAMLLAAGATPGPAALAVALFRLFDLWLPVIAGAAIARFAVHACDSRQGRHAPIPHNEIAGPRPRRLTGDRRLAEHALASASGMLALQVVVPD
jgi:uncharacterized membrane protein YbhN (UPF0104 family)